MPIELKYGRIELYVPLSLTWRVGIVKILFSVDLLVSQARLYGTLKLKIGCLNIKFALFIKIFECNGVKTLLDILRSLNVMKKEQSASANAIWMLCYNEKIKHYVKTQKECYDSIIKLAEASVHEELRRSCKGILMLLNNGKMFFY